MTHVDVTVLGNVTGVEFPRRANELAEVYGVGGYAEERDGAIYLELEGHDEAVRHLIEWCWEGPTRAAVIDVKERPGPLKGFRGFKVGSKDLPLSGAHPA